MAHVPVGTAGRARPRAARGSRPGRRWTASLLSSRTLMSPPISWSDWPARQRPAASAFAGLVIVLTVGLVAAVDPWLAVLGTILLLGSTAEALLPTRFALSEDGVQVHNPLRSVDKGWDRFGGWRAHRDGVFLRGRGKSKFLQRRGVFLRRPPEEITQLLESHLGPSA